MYKVLVVEDEKMIRKGIIYMFDWIKHDCIIVAEASNGIEGLEKIYEHMPDIIIADVTMPLMDGLTMIENTLTDNIYTAIIVSAHEEFQLAQKAIKFGVTEYLIKPLNHDELSQAIERAKIQLKQKRLYSHAKGTDETTFDLNLLAEFKPRESSRKVARLLAYIQSHYAERISINDLVDELNASATNLRQLFKTETNYTFNDFLNRYRILQAINKLKTEGGKIQNIATEVGFSDYHYFINVFKKYTNVPPSHLLQFLNLYET